MSHDDIQNPKHYDLFPDGVQAIDVIRAALTPEEFAGYCKGNFLKYRLRAGEKGDPVKCLGKAEWYRAELRDFHRDRMASVTEAAADWPDETRRQDAAAEDEAFTAIEARNVPRGTQCSNEPYTGRGGVMIQCSGRAALSCECRP